MKMVDPIDPLFDPVDSPRIVFLDHTLKKTIFSNHLKLEIELNELYLNRARMIIRMFSVHKIKNSRCI